MSEIKNKNKAAEFRMFDDKPHEECGIIGVISADKSVDVCEHIYLGLYALQHRGQESAGIATLQGEYVHVKRGNGLLNQVFKRGDFESLKGNLGIGHVRYSTTGSGYIQNVQPIFAQYWGGMMAISHNGNIVNSKEIRDSIIQKGGVVRSSSDTELLLHLIAMEKPGNVENAILNAVGKIKGAYSITLIAEGKLIAIRDPYGFRPLCMGHMPGMYIIASETAALDVVGARFVRDIQPGEMVVINGRKMKSIKFRKNERNALCVFEYIYFARPDSYLDGVSVYKVRKRLGQELARMAKGIEVDVVIPVPDSGITTAIGFAQEAGLDYEIGLFKNSYVGRTFIHPGKDERGTRVRIKLNPIRDVVRGKRLAVLDDSIVRGTTSKRIIRMLRDAGAKEVHMFISSPPITHPCFFGIDTAEKKTLIASTQSVEDIRKFIEVDTLTYITIEGLSRAVGRSTRELCYACFNGDYPVPVEEERGDKMILEDYRVLEM